MVHGITKNCGGTISLKSKVGKGTASYVYLPRMDSDQSLKETRESTAVQTAPTGTERVLFIDDEPELVALGRDMLEHLGYQVVTKNNGIDALQEFRERPNHFDVVVTDMTMPEMTGDVLASRVMTLRPDLLMILCTGYSERITEEAAAALGIRGFVMKPVVFRELSLLLREILDSP